MTILGARHHNMFTSKKQKMKNENLFRHVALEPLLQKLTIKRNATNQKNKQRETMNLPVLHPTGLRCHSQKP